MPAPHPHSSRLCEHKDGHPPPHKGIWEPQGHVGFQVLLTDWAQGPWASL